MPEISVIVLNWNGRHFLQDCLGSLRRQTFLDFETILVDNGSNDESVEFVKENFPEVRVIALPENRGFCGGNNEGIRRAAGRWVVLLNNDTRVDDRWLEAMHEASVKFPDAAMFASKMVSYDDPGTIDNCGFMASRAGSAWEIGRNERDGQEFDPYLRPFGPSGGAAFYRCDLLETVGFLDEDFFMFYEDYDLAFRARLRGYDCRFVPGPVVHHRHGGTIRAYPAYRVYFSQRNVEYVYVKDMPGSLILRYAFLHAIYNLGACVYFTRIGHLRPFLKAKWDVFLALPKLLRKRRVIQSQRVLTSGQVKKLLVWQGLQVSVRKALGMKTVKWPAASLDS